MQDFVQNRTTMVDNQVRTCDVTNIDLLEALLSVPREAFVGADKQDFAYIDEDIALGNGRFLMEPAPFAKLVQACAIKSDDLVLDIGCATGYSTAVLSQLASMVIGVEQDDDLAEKAEATLNELDYDNVAIINGTLNVGYAKEAPYDVIFIGGAIDEVPTAFFDQLKDGGRLVAVEGVGNSAVAKLYTRSGYNVSGRKIFNCSIKLLPGFTKELEFAL